MTSAPKSMAASGVKKMSSKGLIENKSPTTPVTVPNKGSIEAANGDKGDKKKKGKFGKQKLYGGRYKPGGDVFTPAAMENAYYICHNVQDCLYVRGFRWDTTNTSRKGRRKR